MHTPAQLREKASEMELYAVDFYNAEGEYCYDFEDVDHVVFTFIDGEEITIGPDCLDACEDIKFHLRPRDNNA